MSRTTAAVIFCATVRVGLHCQRVSWRAPKDIWPRLMADWRREVLLRYPAIEWLPEEKAWHVPADDADPVLAWLREAFGEPLVILERTPDPDHDAAYHDGSALLAAYQTLYLAPGAPLELVESARRVLARRHHPDAGGDAAVMTAINVAADTILDALTAQK